MRKSAQRANFPKNPIVPLRRPQFHFFDRVNPRIKQVPGFDNGSKRPFPLLSTLVDYNMLTKRQAMRTSSSSSSKSCFHRLACRVKGAELK
jgi:hypothetical protein